jgi:hypothetical protein
MIGQWIGRVDGEWPGTLRVELEDRGFGLTGRAYLFYDAPDIPGILFDIQLPKGSVAHTRVGTIFLYPTGGAMTQQERQAAEQFLATKHGREIPQQFDVELHMAASDLEVAWSASEPGAPEKPGGRKGLLGRAQKQPAGIQQLQGKALLKLSNPIGASALVRRADLVSWDQFRHWAAGQRPRSFIFRGQSRPFKLATSFHRTWRKNLSHWIVQDTELLFGAVAQHLNYPLQQGNMQHNAAIWSILQHHGYPTPMLDWSYSPFVAAYFAFQEQPDVNTAPRIYIFDRESWVARYGRANFIVDMARNQLVVVETMPVGNPRHLPQQAISTVTNIADIEEFIRQRELADGVQYLTVCDLPVGMRPQIMRELEMMGITYGSLFPGLDGICRDMRDRLFTQPT